MVGILAAFVVCVVYYCVYVTSCDLPCGCDVLLYGITAWRSVCLAVVFGLFGLV